MHIFIHQSLFLHLFANWKECLAILSAEVFSTAGSISQSRILNKRARRMDDIRKWLGDNKLRSIGLFWLGSCGGILSYQLTKPITTSAAIMHTRVYAQAATLAALAMAGLVDVYEHRNKTNEDLERYTSKLDKLEQRVHAALSKNSNSEELHKLETRLASVHSGVGGSGQLKELEQQVEKAT